MLVSWCAESRSASLPTSDGCRILARSIVIIAIAFAFEALRFRIAVYDRQVAAQLLQQARRSDGLGTSSGRSSPAIDAFPIGGVYALT